MIKKSFICTGIIYDKNQKEGLFTAWKKMKNENSIIENDLANDKKKKLKQFKKTWNRIINDSLIQKFKD